MLLDGIADATVNFVQFSFANGCLLLHDFGHLFIDNVVDFALSLDVDAILVSELVNEEIRELLSRGLLSN